MATINLSVVLATRNEEANLRRCLESVKEIANEIIVVDEYSTDKTREIAADLGAKVYQEPHHDIFHITKQVALEKAKGRWILQLDADEVVTKELSREIKRVIGMSNEQLLLRKAADFNKQLLFLKHQKLIEHRDGPIGSQSQEIVGFFIPRINMFLGHPLVHAGVYPDGVIRLVKNGKAAFPQKSVHEQITLDGKVAWLSSALEHYDSPTFKRYVSRANRYTDLTAKEFARDNISKNIFMLIYFLILKPGQVFINLYIRHRGFLDGPVGFIWSFFSAVHFPIAYFKYITGKE